MTTIVVALIGHLVKSMTAVKSSNGLTRIAVQLIIALFGATSFGISKRQIDKIDFVLEGLSPYHSPRYNITFKELTEDRKLILVLFLFWQIAKLSLGISQLACYCNKNDVVVGTKPVYTTSPGFPATYCSKFRCKRRFFHNDTLRHGHDSHLAFAVTVHFLSTQKSDYIQFYSDEIAMEKLNGTQEDVRLVFIGDLMETEFVTDDKIVQHGYNMTVKSIQIPTECLCPHKGVKTMPTKGDVRMLIPEYCVAVYCEWIIPSITYDMKFAAVFNFTSKVDMLTITGGNQTRQFSTISEEYAKELWEIPKNSPPVTILYKRNVQATSPLPSAMTSFFVSWMPREGCSCDNGSIKNAVVGEWDVLTSPAYPLSYCNDMLCITRIVAPEGHHVVLNITDFYTEPYKDELKLYDGWNTTLRPMEK
ncbi:unnamed protein product [Haemonchus placei]|uniref:CUB domain-containing protein n=1 Tax=Haemonchus placei TaxID=6290 RepID=A0A0N4XAA6_HAEPC|nr:unnamed protein product [Haemonchus placei]